MTWYVMLYIIYIVYAIQWTSYALYRQWNINQYYLLHCFFLNLLFWPIAIIISIINGNLIDDGKRL